MLFQSFYISNVFLFLFQKLKMVYTIDYVKYVSNNRFYNRLYNRQFIHHFRVVEGFLNQLYTFDNIPRGYYRVKYKSIPRRQLIRLDYWTPTRYCLYKYYGGIESNGARKLTLVSAN